MKMNLDTVNTVMSALVIAQGAHGFIATGSKPALAMGFFIGGLYAVSGYFINEKSTAGAGYAVASLTSLALAGRMGHYYYKSGILVPRGLMAGVAAVAGIHNIKKYLQES